jgi:dTDP-4-dehydrorhamnose reductase
MRILVLGASGMLGHRAWLDLGTDYEVWGTLRVSTPKLVELAGAQAHRLLAGVDVDNPNSLVEAFDKVKPDVAINCIGLIKQRQAEIDHLRAIDLNSRLPHQLANLCRLTGSRLIHISTDCVFSGKKGMYTEDDISDAEDVYGKTKFLGEITDQSHCLTIRTSYVGHELASNYGLLDWFLSQKREVLGYTNAIFSGFTTTAFVEILRSCILPNANLSGLYHISSDPISKYDLLQLFNDSYGKQLIIKPASEVMIDRSLDSSQFRLAAGFSPPDWPDMVRSMADKNSSIYRREA